jgi:hypothetical protein
MSSKPAACSIASSTEDMLCHTACCAGRKDRAVVVFWCCIRVVVIRSDPNKRTNGMIGAENLRIKLAEVGSPPAEVRVEVIGKRAEVS